MDLQTVKQRDFQSFKIEKTNDFKPKPNPQSLQFVSRSCYQTNYPNWGPNDVIRVKKLWLPYRGDEVKIDPKTTYSQSYKQPIPSREPKDLFNKSSGSMWSSGSATGLLGTGTEFYGQTTSMRTFRPFSKVQMAKKETTPNHDFTAMESPERHFKTTYGADFVPKEVKIRPMKLKSQLAL